MSRTRQLYRSRNALVGGVCAGIAERFDVDPLAESGRGLRLILRAVDYFNVETRAGENVTTLIKALPDAVLRHSTDDRVR